MKIVLDLQAAQSESRHRGIGRYSLSLAQAIIRNRGSHDVTVTLNHVFPDTIEPLRETFGKLLAEEKIRVYRTLPRAMSRDPANGWRNRAGQLIRESFLASLGADLVHTFSIFEGWGDDSVVSCGCLPCDFIYSATLHDLIPYARPEHYLPTPEQQAWYSEQLQSLQRCGLLLSNSDHTRAAAIELLGLPDDRITSVSADADPLFRPLDASLPTHAERLRQFGIRRPFIMYTGVISRDDPRKNFAGLLQAYALLSPALRAQYQLVLVGRYNAYDQHDMQVESARLGIDPGQLVFTDRVSDDDLVLLYSGCELFVFPSLEEGFGLPALEAMRCGAVVIGSDCSSIPEVIANPSALFDPANSEDMARTMERALTDQALRQAILDSSVVQSSRFSWDRSGEMAVAAFEQRYAQTGPRSRSKSSHSSGPPAGQRASLAPGLSNGLVQLGADAGRPGRQDLVYCAQAIAENQHWRAQRKLYLDVSVLIDIDAKTGIQRVVRSLLNELGCTPIQGVLVRPVYFEQGVGFRELDYRPEAPDLLQRDERDEVIDIVAGDIYLGLDLDLEGVVHEVRNSFLRYQRQRGLGIYYIVYDLLPILQGSSFHIGLRERFPFWLGYAAGESDGLICISRSVADEVLAWLAANPPRRQSVLKLGYFHLGADIESSLPSTGLPDNAERLLRQLRERPSLLMVGTIEPRKGQQQALRAMELLWQEGIEANLVLVGKSGWHMEQFEKRLNSHPQNEKQLFWLQGISDEMLQQVYDASSVLLAASSGEGFGLPLIEAARHGLPILARDLPVFQEVAGDHAMYFSGDAPQDLAASLQHWLELHESGEVVSSAGINWLSWKESARQLKALVLNEGDWYTSWQPETSILP